MKNFVTWITAVFWHAVLWLYFLFAVLAYIIGYGVMCTIGDFPVFMDEMSDLVTSLKRQWRKKGRL